jgi:trans-aconitate 2-methyltransferase
MWEAKQYLKYSEQRSRPFFDLLSRVRNERVHHVADLGCGPGNLTCTLHERWPAALVVGVDNSAEMLEQAQPLAIPGRLEFTRADIASWSPSRQLDVIASNAALQWVGDHEILLIRLAKMLAPGGTLAVQMPYYFEHPAHGAIEETKADPRWRATLQGIGLHQKSVLPLVWYVERLHDLGLAVDAWETTYIHVWKAKTRCSSGTRGRHCGPC